MQLAKSKMNIVLISRTQSKLDTVAEEIKAANKDVKVRHASGNALPHAMAGGVGITAAGHCKIGQVGVCSS